MIRDDTSVISISGRASGDGATASASLAGYQTRLYGAASMYAPIAAVKRNSGDDVSAHTAHYRRIERRDKTLEGDYARAFQASPHLFMRGRVSYFTKLYRSYALDDGASLEIRALKCLKGILRVKSSIQPHFFHTFYAHARRAQFVFTSAIAIRQCLISLREISAGVVGYLLIVLIRKRQAGYLRFSEMR